MPKCVLIEHRPWLLAAIVAAIAFTLLEDSTVPERYLIALEFLPFALLANYALARERGSDANLLALMLFLEGVGAALFDVHDYQASVFTAAGFSVGIGIFLKHLREDFTSRHTGPVALLLFLLPVAFLFVTGTSRGASPAFQGLALGGMVAGAWASTFSRLRVGSGAVIVMIGTMIAVQWPGHWLSWPLFFGGNLVLAIGVTTELLAQEA